MDRSAGDAEKAALASLPHPETHIIDGDFTSHVGYVNNSKDSCSHPLCFCVLAFVVVVLRC